MLAQISLRHLMISIQFVIGVVLLTASYLTHDHSIMADGQTKVDNQVQFGIEKSSDKIERC
ncbi:MAG: hypothetical protein KJO69_01385 [Gammaproteobacteria bacterium]|nr:hypothetical protein [Gammaproteobacteria bacterium]